MGLKHFYEPTPKRMRKIGDTILVGTTMLSVYVSTSPISDNNKAWVTTSLQIIGVIGKMLMNFFKEEDVTEKPDQN